MASQTVREPHLVEPHRPRGSHLDACARASGAVLDKASVPFPGPNTDASDAATWVRATLAALGSANQTALSSVSRSAIAFIENTLDGVPRLSDAARLLRLSPDATNACVHHRSQNSVPSDHTRNHALMIVTCS